jgi:hypothetical protein
MLARLPVRQAADRDLPLRLALPAGPAGGRAGGDLSALADHRRMNDGRASPPARFQMSGNCSIGLARQISAKPAAGSPSAFALPARAASLWGAGEGVGKGDLPCSQDYASYSVDTRSRPTNSVFSTTGSFRFEVKPSKLSTSVQAVVATRLAAMHDNLFVAMSALRSGSGRSRPLA